jgi:hypothetical protein
MRTSWYYRSNMKMCFVSAFSVRRPIFSNAFLFFTRIYMSDYGVWNPYLASSQWLYPNMYERQCSLNRSTLVEALHHDVRQADLTVRAPCLFHIHEAPLGVKNDPRHISGTTAARNKISMATPIFEVKVFNIADADFRSHGLIPEINMATVIMQERKATILGDVPTSTLTENTKWRLAKPEVLASRVLA